MEPKKIESDEEMNQETAQLQDPKYYAGLDIGDLYGLMHTANASELEIIKDAGIILGHDGIIDYAYKQINLQELLKNGAIKKDILDYKDAVLGHVVRDEKGRIIDDVKDEDTIKRICDKYDVIPKTATKSELEAALKNATGFRGFSIDETHTSVGNLYQRLFGRDFERIVIGIQTPKGILKFPYSKLDNKGREFVNRAVLKKKDSFKESVIAHIGKNQKD